MGITVPPLLVKIWKKIHFPMVLDLVGDEVRSRMFNVLLILAIIATAVALYITPYLLPPQDFFNTNSNSKWICPPNYQIVETSDTEAYCVPSAPTGWSQYGIIIFALVLIPLFITNSAHTTRFLLLLGYPLVGLCCFIVVGIIIDPVEFTTLDKAARILSVIAAGMMVFMFVLTSIRMCKCKSKFFGKVYSYERKEAYLKHTRSLVTYGHKNFLIKKDKEEEKTKIQHTEKQKDLSFVQNIQQKIAKMVGKFKVLFDTYTKKDPSFFYPQRLLLGATAGVYMAFIAMFVCMYLNDFVNYLLVSIQGALSICDQFQQLSAGGGTTTQTKRQTGDNTNTDTNTGTDGNGNGQIPATTGSSFCSQYKDLLGDWADRVHIIGICASVLSLMLTICLIVLVMLRYKKRLLDLRKGKYFFKRGSAKPFKSSNYFGMFVMHILIGFIFFFVVWFALLTFLVSPFLQKFLKDKILQSLVTLLALPIVPIILLFLVKILFIKDDMVIHRRWYAFADFLMLIFKAISSILPAFTRLAEGIFFLFTRFLLMDTPLFTILADPGFSAYIGLMIMDHHHNNPVVTTSIGLLLADARKKRTAEQLRRERVINRYWLAVTLIHNPSLIPECRRGSPISVVIDKKSKSSKTKKGNPPAETLDVAVSRDLRVSSSQDSLVNPSGSIN